MVKQSVLSALAVAGSIVTPKVIHLSEETWTLSNEALNISVAARLPSQAHLDLYSAGIIDLPSFDLNDFSLRWVAYNNWTYTSDPIDDLNASFDSAWLQFDGLDTFTTISFCDQFVAYTDNQFRQYIFNITDILRVCEPEDRVISLNFGSAPLIANATAERPGQEVYPDGIQFTYEFANSYYIRKQQSDFGWDWGPAFAPAGPWRPAYIVQLDHDEVHVRNAAIDIFREGQFPLIPPEQTRDWVLNASLDFFGHLHHSTRMMFVLEDLDGDCIEHGEMQHVNKTNTSITGMYKISKDLIKLWWPVGMGEQTMYNLHIILKADHKRTTVSRRVGFRTIVLDMSPISEDQLAKGVAPGNNWKFEINGHEFYAMGSNFIPPDPFWANATEARLATLLDSVVEGNQNILRVWASGAYLPDFIYDLADARGILLWSEFQFSDHLYPIDDGFLDNVREEAEYNVRRVNHHPSLALWAGGNELESLMLQQIVKGYAPELYDRYVEEYGRLFIDVLSPVVFSNTRSISYTPSSTGNGWLTLDYSADPLKPFTERYLNLTKGHIYGNRDFYNYDPRVLGDLGKYPIGRFTNEFGFLSMPSVQSWRQQVSEHELYFRSPVTTLRCHHNVPDGLNTSNYDAANVGYQQMIDAVQTWYPMPRKSDPIANLSAWAYATQVFQADLYRSEIEFYRRGSGMPERQLGSLYWQLEDQWVAPTWAGIEYDGRWKMLHYAVKDIYEPVIIAPYYNATNRQLTVYVTSSLWEDIEGEASFALCDWEGEQTHRELSVSRSFIVVPLNTTKIWEQTLNGPIWQDLNNTLLRMNITARGRLPNDEEVRIFHHEHWFHPAPLKDADLVDPGLRLSYDRSTDNFTVTATSGVAAWVFVDYPAGAVISFDSNAFWLNKGESRQLSYKVRSDETDGRWKHGATVMSMWDLTLMA